MSRRMEGEPVQGVVMFKQYSGAGVAVVEAVVVGEAVVEVAVVVVAADVVVVVVVVATFGGVQKQSSASGCPVAVFPHWPG